MVMEGEVEGDRVGIKEWEGRGEGEEEVDGVVEWEGEGQGEGEPLPPELAVKEGEGDREAEPVVVMVGDELGQDVAEARGVEDWEPEGEGEWVVDTDPVEVEERHRVATGLIEGVVEGHMVEVEQCVVDAVCEGQAELDWDGVSEEHPVGVAETEEDKEESGEPEMVGVREAVTQAVADGLCDTLGEALVVAHVLGEWEVVLDTHPVEEEESEGD